MKSVLIAIVYHSGYGHTRRQAEAVKRGVEQVEDAEALLLSIEEAQMPGVTWPRPKPSSSARRLTQAASRRRSKHSRRHPPMQS